MMTALAALAILAVPGPAVAIQRASGLNRASETTAKCPSNTCTCAPVFVSHTIASWSPLAVTSCFPSGENATEKTVARCPFSSTTDPSGWVISMPVTNPAGASPSKAISRWWPSRASR